MKDQFERIEIKLLDIKYQRIIKRIRLNKQVETHHIWADLIYSREVGTNYTTEYRKKTTDSSLFARTEIVYPNDDFDKMVLKAVRTEYPHAEMVSLNINTDRCIEHLKNRYDEYLVEQATIYLNPDFSRINVARIPRDTDSIYTQFRINLDIFVPCKNWCVFFKNEGYFDRYDLENTEKLGKLLDESSLTVHRMEEMWQHH